MKKLWQRFKEIDDGVTGWLVGCVIFWTLFLAIALTIYKAKGQDYPDGPDLPPLPHKVVEIVVEKEEIVVKKEDKDDIILLDKNLICPVKFMIHGELESFEGHCEGVAIEDSIIGIPPNCWFAFKAEGYSLKRVLVQYCPSVILMLDTENWRG